MSETSTRDLVLSILGRAAPETDLADLGPAEPLREALDLDSMDFLEVVIGIRRQLGIEIPEADYAGLDTLENLLAYLASKTNAGG